MKKHPFISLLLVAVAVIFLLPPWLLIVQALIPSFDAILVSSFAQPLVFFAAMPVTEQFEDLFQRHTDVLSIISRDILWCFSSSAIQVILSVICGFLLAKYRSHFTEHTVLLYTLTLVLPMQMFLIPLYRITEWIGMAGNPIFMYLVVAFSPLGAILMRQVFLKMPDEYAESYRLEDTRMSRFLLHVVFPTGLPIAGVLFLLSFVDAWSMVEQPLLLLSDKRLYPLSMMLYEMRTHEPDTVYAASLCAFFPICILLLIFLTLGVRIYLAKKFIYSKDF